jgi:molybdopterin synthase catalytic subunit
VVVEVVDERAGAIATFLGTVRAQSRGRDVIALEYEAYEEMAEDAMAEIAEELRARYDLCKVAISHRLGRVEVGETSVAIAVSAPHRQDALAACADAIEASRRACRSGRRSSTRAARSGSAAAHRRMSGLPPSGRRPR